MKAIRESLRFKKQGHGHYNVSLEIGNNKYSILTTNSMAIDAAFDNYEEDGRFYETQEEAQDALINEIFRANDLDIDDFN